MTEEANPEGEGHNITSRSCRLCHNHSKGGVQSSVSKPLNKSLS
jgi:cytochrome c5